MNEKDYRTIESLVELLESRGVNTDNNTRFIIMSESYYAVVNGYKDPFLDTYKMQGTQNDVYRDGTQFSEIYDLFCFDRELRNITFLYLAKAEAVMKTTTVYAFCSTHPGHEDYLESQNYVTAENMLFPKGYRGNRQHVHDKDIEDLLKTLNQKVFENREHKDFISHYKRKYGYIPLWVLSNDLSFGVMAHFFQLLTPSIQNDVCHQVFDIKQHDDASYTKIITPHEMLRAFNVLKEYRNLCAHDERLYCARAGRSHDVSFFDMMKCLNTVLPESDVIEFRKDVGNLVDSYKERFISISAADIFNKMGYKAVG